MKPLAIGYVIWAVVVLGLFVEVSRRDRAYARRERDLRRHGLRLIAVEEIQAELEAARQAAAYDKVFRDMMLPPEDVEVEVSEFGVFVGSQDLGVVASVVATHPAFGGHQ